MNYTQKNNFHMLSHVQHTRHFAGTKKIDIHDQLMERYACHRKYAPITNIPGGPHILVT